MTLAQARRCRGRGYRYAILVGEANDALPRAQLSNELGAPVRRAQVQPEVVAQPRPRRVRADLAAMQLELIDDIGIREQGDDRLDSIALAQLFPPPRLVLPCFRLRDIDAVRKENDDATSFGGPRRFLQLA